jgi:hypothetical protein
MAATRRPAAWGLATHRGGGAAMRFLFQLCFTFIVTATLVGCGSTPSRDFEHSARATIKRVTIIDIGTPEHAQARIMNPIGAGFGVVGNFVEARRKAGATQEMENALAAAHFDFHTSLANAIIKAVSKVGFTVTRPSDPRPAKEQGRFLSKYPPAKKVDAYLDVYASYVGFEAPQSSTAYRPRIEIAARLVSAKDHQVLFQDRIIYGCIENADEDAVLVRADDGLSFRNRAAFQADPSRTARALQSAIDATAWELAKQFM